MKRILIFLCLALSLVACASNRLTPFCDEPVVLNGYVESVTPDRYLTRVVVLRDGESNKSFKIYGVPITVDLVDIHACKYGGDYYWSNK